MQRITNSSRKEEEKSCFSLPSPTAETKESKKVAQKMD
jgi:hypothetical protein